MTQDDCPIFRELFWLDAVQEVEAQLCGAEGDHYYDIHGERGQ